MDMLAGVVVRGGWEGALLASGYSQNAGVSIGMCASGLFPFLFFRNAGSEMERAEACTCLE